MAIKETSQIVKIDARGLHYRELNARLREVVSNGARKVELHNVYGQRYIGTDLDKPVEIEIFGTPGNDLGAFMNGPRITVHGNAQDGCGNTMSSGEIIVHGHGGDILGLSARGGKIFVQSDVGYRAGIHMKEYQDRKPVVVIGGTAQDFLGEYMAGGVLVLLGLNLGEGEYHKARFIGTGMHGGIIYIRGNVKDYQLGKEVGVADLNEEDSKLLAKLVTEFAAHFGGKPAEILKHDFIKLFPRWLRPYGRLYTY
jgi:glutamate synthase domain-containing protein 3